MPASSLKPKSKLLNLDGSFIEVSKVTFFSENTTVYNLTISNNHNYYVGNATVLSHNAGGCDIGGELLKLGKLKKLDDKYLKREGIDAHAAKKIIMGSDKRNARFDIVLEKGSKRVFLKSKNGELIDSTYSLEELKFEAPLKR